MIVNTNHRGRTDGGRTTYRPLIQLEADDYPPESRYWFLRCKTAQSDLGKIIGAELYCSWANNVWPEATIEEMTWKDIALITEAAAMATQAGNIDELVEVALDAWPKHSMSQERPA